LDEHGCFTWGLLTIIFNVFNAFYFNEHLFNFQLLSSKWIVHLRR
jgi:hypothetical protein